MRSRGYGGWESLSLSLNLRIHSFGTWLGPNAVLIYFFSEVGMRDWEESKSHESRILRLQTPK